MVHACNAQEHYEASKESSLKTKVSPLTLKEDCGDAKGYRNAAKA